MCRCLRIHPSGFYAWLKNPLSKRALEDTRQTELILREQGETCCPNRVARLAKLAGIKALIGHKRRPGSYGGKPSMIVNNTLARQFDIGAPDKVWVTDIT
jgi:putative transposase